MHHMANVLYKDSDICLNGVYNSISAQDSNKLPYT
jgi:hypothetical protein